MYNRAMGSDLVALSALAEELNVALSGARVDKIVQPDPDELRFFLRNNGKNLCLCISCNSGAPRIHITTSKKQNPINAPSLCMLLRKHLQTSSIEGVSIFNNDRTLQVKFKARTEMKDDAIYYLFAEIMNRYSNIVFTDESLTILDAVKHLPLDATRNHVVLRG
ncbi:MAG: NFACT family protein, partial [Clostridia bacterium]|nr:NFACT family protein [Clostridia bacterium]